MTDAVRTQILATEHWSLLATRSMTWNEIFSRATMFMTVLSAAVVGIALVAQATDFGPGARLFALLVLPVVFLVGLMTFVRLGEANSDGIMLVIGMNRLRHAYLELAPELEPYFITAHHDDHTAILQSHGAGYRYSVGRVLGGTPALVAIINVVLAGVVAALAAHGLGATEALVIAVGLAGALVVAAGQAALVARAMARGRADYRPRFPTGQRRPETQCQTVTLTAMSSSFTSQSPACSAASLQDTFSWTTELIGRITASATHSPSPRITPSAQPVRSPIAASQATTKE